MQLKKFSQGWALLNNRFKSSCDESIMAIYFQHLQGQLTDEQFEIAIKRCILEETFFPSAKQILDKVFQKNQLKAISEWDKVTKLLPDYAIALATNSRFICTLDASTQAIIKSIGGWKALSEGSEKDMIFLRKAFLNHFEDKHQETSRQIALSGTQQKAIGGAS